jgi:putative inorganic carbon (hco3(-)) transporter
MPDTIIFIVNLLGYFNRSIEYLFYTLLLLVPLVFAGHTSELFEFNKMWLTFGIAIAIGFLWFSKMIILKKVVFRRTIFDIPILLFVISLFISTIISLDSHISLWGYYSRWNGGLLSMLTYIFLFYAFVSNFFDEESEQNPNLNKNQNKSNGFFERIPTGKQVVGNSLIVSLISGAIVVLWALPSHFGYDPTCLVFRGTFDVSCWTADFQPKVRIFGPLGQPAWLAAYLAILLPISAAFIIQELRNKKEITNSRLIMHSILFALMYISLLYTGTRSGIIGVFVSLFLFAAGYIYLNRKNLGFLKNKFIPIFLIVLFIGTFLAGIELPNGKRFSYSDVLNAVREDPPATQTPSANPNQEAPQSSIPLGGSSSGQIRAIVWKGAVEAWKANPIIGTGVETFAFAYYKHRPVEHNLVSEWNFLYNKAHNEYLNYLVTQGIFGLGTYILFIAFLFIVALINIFRVKIKEIKYVGSLSAANGWDNKDPFLLALLASIVATLIINFFGFSVVITNIYLFLIPAFILIMLGLNKKISSDEKVKNLYVSSGQWLGVTTLGIIGLFLIGLLFHYWRADTKYALGFNYNQAGDAQTAYPLLQQAVKMRDEPVFKNEMAVNDANLAIVLASQAASESAQTIQTLANEAITTTENLTQEYPNNVVFWKTKVRVLYSLARIDPNLYPIALTAIEQTAKLAPTDASILYNLGVLYGQNGNSAKAIEVLDKTVEYRPHYSEARFALALFYHDLAVDSQSGRIKDAENHRKAIEQLEYILTNLNPKDEQSKQYLEAWQKES